MRTQPLHVFVINMDTPNGRTRWPKIARECAAAGLECERVEGINGAQLSSATVNDVADAVCRSVCSPGMVGCALSHMRCWREVVGRDLPWALILEDDATLAPEFTTRLERILHHAPPGWHVITAGCFNCGPVLQRVFQAVSGRSAPLFDNGVVREMRFFNGTHAYLVSQAGARHLVQHAPRVKFHIDVQMSTTPGLRLFGVHEDIAFQGAESATSALVSLDFPTGVNTLLSSIKDSKGVGLDFYANVAIMRLGPYDGTHVLITPLTVVFFFIGLARTPWRWIAGLSALDMALFRPRSVKVPATLLGAYALGYGLRGLKRWG